MEVRAIFKYFFSILQVPEYYRKEASSSQLELDMAFGLPFLMYPLGKIFLHWPYSYELVDQRMVLHVTSVSLQFVHQNDESRFLHRTWQTFSSVACLPSRPEDRSYHFVCILCLLLIVGVLVGVSCRRILVGRDLSHPFFLCYSTLKNNLLVSNFAEVVRVLGHCCLIHGFRCAIRVAELAPACMMLLILLL